MGKTLTMGETLMRCGLVLTMVLVTAAAAQQERAIGNFAGVGTRSMAMGGAYVGVADDFTAVFWNPAGLAQIRQREVYVSLNRHGFDNDASWRYLSDCSGKQHPIRLFGIRTTLACCAR